MAAISRIQVANFLTEGYMTGKEWAPLYRGETFRLFGQPTAMQIDNGGGKTSLTEACLYALTRHRQLKSRVEDRVAPPDKGWTHIRFEFVEKSHEEDILQTELITLDPEDIPGITYVVGMCWSRTKDPSFYSYQGTLEDAPCYIREQNKLALIANDVFRKSVEGMPGARWNRWRNQAEWLEEIRQFTNIEVLLQNVEFQLEGAGDYSAMITKVKPEGAETYDTAFFRQFVAPELLKHAMGAEGDPDELGFEDTILKTLKPAADALLDINRRQLELEQTKEALRKFEPVLQKASEVVTANAEYQREMNALARNAAIVHSLSMASPLPGIPVIPPGTQWASDKRVMTALGHMVIDKKHGTVITDEGLAALIGVPTNEINKRSDTSNIVMLDSETIGLSEHLKSTKPSEPSGGEGQEEAQPFENKQHLKRLGRGGRRYYTKCYPLKPALSISSACSNLAGAKTSGLTDVLTRAFGIAADEIDTNPYRHRLRKLTLSLDEARGRQRTAQGDCDRYQASYEKLLTESRDAKENQAAYEGFMARKHEFPKEYWSTPLAAQEWAEAAAKKAEEERTEHVTLSAKRQSGYGLWQKLAEKHGQTSLQEALATLSELHAKAVEAKSTAEGDLGQANAQLRNKRTELERDERNLGVATKRLEKLSGLAAYRPKFIEIFGAVDPLGLSPQAEMQRVQGDKSKNDGQLQDADTKKQELLGLQPMAKLFLEMFGDAGPDGLDPVGDLQSHLEAIATEDGVVADHQPLVEALTYFREQLPGISPDDWLAHASDQRRMLIEERGSNQNNIRDLTGELEDLDSFGAADDRVYAKALKVLADNGIRFDRLHDLASRTVSGDRLETCLSLFSAALSAPAIASVEEAANAARLLEQSELTVPIFLKPALESFILDGEIHQSGETAHALWVGRRTRQVDIILDPALIAEEKRRIEEQIGNLTRRNEQIGELVADISEDSAAVKTALSAKEAIRRDSERIHDEAARKRDALQAKKTWFEERASTRALEAISSMKRYIKAGGEIRYLELVETIIPGLENEKKSISERLADLRAQTEEDALRALHAAKDFQREGGEDALAAAKTAATDLSLKVKSLKYAVDELQGKVDNELREAFNKAAEILSEISKTFPIDKRDLEVSILFEEEGFVEFMKTADSKRQRLEAELVTAQKRLQGIAFDRAARYIDATRSGERSIADRIADAQEKRDEADEAAKNAGRDITQIEGEMATMTPFMETMHEMVSSIRVQYAKVSLFSEDILRLMQASPFSDPEILVHAETIRIACTGEIPSTAQDIKIAMLNLRQCVEELEINTDELRRFGEDKRRRLSEYIQRRDEFCDRARSGEIRGLNQLEISAIAEAKTIEQLQRIQETQDAIQAQITESEASLAKIREAMEANKEASIDNLAKFARDAKLSLDILERVMKKTPNARFYIEAPVADESEIGRIIAELLEQIEDKERVVRERGVILLNDEIERKTADYKRLIHDTIYKRIFSARDKDENSIVPRVYFTHASIRGKDKVPFTDRGLSTGQRTALAMMWLIKQAEFAIARAASLYGTRKERKAALKGAQRIMFFDGLFSNLSNEDYINDAFQGLRGVGDNFQLIGLIHNPYYVNNKDIFPVHLVGRKKVANKGDPGRERVFVSVEPWQDSNGVILYTSAYKHKAHMAGEETVNA